MDNIFCDKCKTVNKINKIIFFKEYRAFFSGTEIFIFMVFDEKKQMTQEFHCVVKIPQDKKKKIVDKIFGDYDAKKITVRTIPEEYNEEIYNSIDFYNMKDCCPFFAEHLVNIFNSKK